MFSKKKKIQLLFKSVLGGLRVTIHKVKTWCDTQGTRRGMFQRGRCHRFGTVCLIVENVTV